MKHHLSIIILTSLTLASPGLCDPPSYTPPVISARFNVRYSWGLGKGAVDSIGKDRMATTDRYNLPASKPVFKGTAAEQTIQGKVEGLPFEIYIRLTRDADSDPGRLEINVLDQTSHQPLPGFPKKILRALAELKTEQDGVQVDLALTKPQNAVLVKWLRAGLKRDGTDVHGAVVADAPFLRIQTGVREPEE